MKPRNLGFLSCFNKGLTKVKKELTNPSFCDSISLTFKGVVKVNNNTQDSYYLFYQMMYEALKTDDVIEGLNKSLYLLKEYLNCGDIVLHRKDEKGKYRHYINQSKMKHSVEPIQYIVDKVSNLVEIKKSFSFDLKLSEDCQNMVLLYMKPCKYEYILYINNFNNKDNNFLKKIVETMEIILKRAEMYEKNTTAINKDTLTGLNNRNSYENTIKQINGDNVEFVYGLFDLFRLKYVNDNYSHDLGDKYIVSVAKILNKYWPEYEVEIQDNDSHKNVKTGNCIYRVGGDEFVLISTNEAIALTKIKAALAAEEVSMLNLGTKENLPLGLNYGIVTHNPNSTIKESYVSADEIMSEDKKKMYTKYGLERRK